MKSWLGSLVIAVGIASGGCETDVKDDTTRETPDGGSAVSLPDAEAPAEDQDSTALEPADLPEQTDSGTLDASEPSETGILDASEPSETGTLDASEPSETGTAPVTPAGPIGAGTGPTVSSVITSVAFEQSTEDRPIPMLLFEGGYGSFNVNQLVTPIDIAHDVVEHPAAWPAWRRTARGVERQLSTGWTPLVYMFECGALPKGTRLSGTFQQRWVKNASNQATRVTIERFRFASDGTFESCAMEKTAIVVTGTINTIRTQHSGSYAIDGYTLQLSYEDGTTGTFPFFYDPEQPTRLWIRQTFYPVAAVENAAICVAP